MRQAITITAIFALALASMTVAQAAPEDRSDRSGRSGRSERSERSNRSDIPSIGQQVTALPVERQEDGTAGPDIQVRVYNAGAVPAADRAVTLRAAAAVMSAAGISTTWLTCGDDTSNDSALCNMPLEASELSIRLVNLPGTASAHGELSLGYSLVDTRAGAGKLATIYVDRVRWLADQAGVDVRPLVGFAFAHEIGHLLLGTNAHSHTGLMRAIWSRTQLQRSGAADWLFAPAEAARMRASVLRLKGLRSSHLDFHANDCPAPVDGTSAAATGTAVCAGALGSVRGVAAGGHR